MVTGIGTIQGFWASSQARAGFRVGYEDPSYFSREYKKLFGAPPQRDIARLRSDLEL